MVMSDMASSIRITGPYFMKAVVSTEGELNTWPIRAEDRVT